MLQEIKPHNYLKVNACLYYATLATCGYNLGEGIQKGLDSPVKL